MICIVRLSFISFFAVAFTACEKDPIQYTFTGTVTESVSQSALAGTDVTISQKTYDGTVASNYFTGAGSATTDGSGAYTIAFDREKVVEFKIALNKDGYFEHSEIIASGDVSTEEDNVYSFVMEPKSWVRFNLVNLGGSPSDEFTMINYNFREGCSECTSNTYHYYYGVVDSTFKISTTGGVYARYSFKPPGASAYIDDSVYTTLFDTVVVDINY